jgi:predicted PurR-regulated permease PerM
MTFFFMASGDLFKRKLVKIAGPSLNQKKITVQVLDEISSQVQRFLFIQLVTGTLVGVCSWAAFRWYGLDQPAVWGVAAGVLNTIPYFGPIILAGGLAIASLLQFASFTSAAAVVALALVISGIEGFVITPLMVGRASRMNDVAVFVSLMFWGWLWGAVGMLLAIPMMMAIKSTCDRVESLAPIGELLGK